MISLSKITIRAFRSFEDEVSIHFPKSGFVLIDGKNMDTGGSSGSGKTSIVEAIAFVLGYAKLPATELQNRNTKEKLQVVLTIRSPKGDIEIARGKDTYIKYLESDQTIKGAAPFQEEIKKILGLSTDLVEALTYRPQRSFGRFVSMTDAEKKEFLTNCLPELQEIEDVAELAKANYDSLVNQLREAENQTTSLEAELSRHLSNDPSQIFKPIDINTLTEKISSLKEEHSSLAIEVEKSKGILNSLAALNKEEMDSYSGFLRTKVEADIQNLENSIQQYVAARGKLTYDLAETESLMASLEAKHKEGTALLRKNVDEMRSRQREFLSIYATRPDLERQIQQLTPRIAALLSNTCPTCNREWLENKAKLQELETEKFKLDQKLALLPAVQQKIEAIEQQIKKEEEKKLDTSDLDNARKRQLELTKQLTEIQGQMRLIETQKQQIGADVDSKVLTRRAELRARESDHVRKHGEIESAANRKLLEYQHAVRELESAKLQSKAHEEQMVRHKANVESVQKLLNASRDQIPVLKERMALEDAVRAALGRQGYLGSIFDEILVSIGHEVTEVLSRVPNVSTVSLKFDSSSETKKGTVKRAIVPIVTKDGVQASYASLSGGQQSSVELAVDLAIGNVIGRRTGRTPGWIVLDEAMDGLDLPAKESCMEILKRYAADRLILMVDHSTELKEAFETTINVTMQSGVSSV